MPQLELGHLYKMLLQTQRKKMNICHKIEDISKLYAVPLTAQIHHPSMPKKSFLNARS